MARVIRRIVRTETTVTWTVTITEAPTHKGARPNPMTESRPRRLPAGAPEAAEPADPAQAEAEHSKALTNGTSTVTADDQAEITP